MTPITVGSTDYHKLVRSYAWLLWVKANRPLTTLEAAAFAQVNAALEAAEMVHVPRPPRGRAQACPVGRAPDATVDYDLALRLAGAVT
jgi:hypothetical protein